MLGSEASQLTLKPLMTHFCLQILVNPEAGEDGVTLTGSQHRFTVKTYDPRLDRKILWSRTTPYQPELRAARVLQIAMMATFREAPGELLEWVTRLIGELYRAKGFEEVAKHVEYVLATQPEAQRKVFSEALRRNVPGRGGEVMNYVEEIIERGRREGRQEGRREGELKGQVRAIEGFVARDIPWPTIEAATGIDEATFRRLRQRVDAKDNGTESTV